MPGNRNALRYTWIVIGGGLVYTGLHLAVTQKLYGKVHVGGDPILQGWPVTGLGLAEAALGAFLIWRWWRH